MEIEELTARAEPEYEDFVRRATPSLIYGSLQFRRFLCRAVGGQPTYLLARDRHGRIVGALPYFVYEAAGIGRVVNSLPWYGSHGGCVLSGVRSSAARRALLCRYAEVAGSEDVLSATVILSPGEQEFLEEYRSSLGPEAEDRRIGQVTTLPESRVDVEAALASVLRQKTRNLVRKALRQGFVLCERDDDAAWRFLFETHKQNMKAVEGRWKPWRHFTALRDVFSCQARRLLTAELDGSPVAALLLLYFERTVEYVVPVVRREFRPRQPLSFLIWHAMLDAARAGFRWWNWGGTWPTQKSLHHFKAGWGAVDLPYSYLVVSSPEGRAVLAANRQRLDEVFPFYYSYPYEQL